MLMPKKNRVAIYEHLFKEGVMVAERDLFLPKHPELEKIPNLHVIKALQIVPATLKKPTRPEGRPRPMQSRPEGPRGEGSRDAYRRAPSGMDKTGDAGAGSSTVEFRGGFGRGSKRPQ
ncbi:hypothetical protein O3P69_016606 [Scylla paramamosain]|uniref:Plectin/eS10 N-terminal domain-containing protein n=1 Tax=Scylla paramamosain TaxID=85552 RepID=A0AAW0SZG7_SCYPA